MLKAVILRLRYASFLLIALLSLSACTAEGLVAVIGLTYLNNLGQESTASKFVRQEFSKHIENFSNICLDKREKMKVDTKLMAQQRIAFTPMSLFFCIALAIMG